MIVLRPQASRTLFVMQTAVAVIALTAVVKFPTRLVWNASASVPIGFYASRPIQRLAKGELVLVRPPEPFATWLADRGYIGTGVPLLKRIAALPTQTACREGLEVSVDGMTMAKARERDRLGRPLPRWSGCRTLAAGEVFFLNADAPDSMDSRYFGPLPTSSIIGRATPIWTSGKH